MESEKIAHTLAPYIDMLVRYDVATVEQLQEQAKDLDKTAHREVDPSHPFVAGFSALETLRGEMGKTAAALVDIDAQLARVQKTIREELLRAR